MLEGKTAIVTGAAGDLGEAMARHLAEAGAKVTLWDIKSELDAGPALERVQAHDPDARYQQVDVRDRDQVDRAIAALPQLDIVCSNAGIVEAQPFLEVTQRNWQNHLDINLTGCFNVCQAAARVMVTNGTGGRIILTSSWVGVIPWPEITPYSVSKAGVNMLVKQMARELAPHRILVNGVAPGIVNGGTGGPSTARRTAIRGARGQGHPIGGTRLAGRNRPSRGLSGGSANGLYDRQHPDAGWGLLAVSV